MGKSDAAATLVALIAAVALLAVGVVRGTRAVGGSDSSCYALMAQAMAEGKLQPSSPLAVEAPWPNAPLTVAPGGFIPSPVRPDAASPICAPGMALLMAPMAALFGRDAIFLVVPGAGAALVMAAFIIARYLAGAMAGAAAAILTATSPIVLYQIVQPMNDVVTAALWISAFAAIIVGRSVTAGALVGAAVLVRPNLAPLAAVIALAPLPLGRQLARRSIGMIAAGATPGLVVLWYLNHALYGSVIGSGYGDAAQLFSISNVGDNAANFGRALVATQNVVPVVALAAPIWFSGARRRLSLVLLAAVAVIAAIYLCYRPYPEWWYLRFLMPAIVLSLVLASSVAVEAAAHARVGGLLLLAVVVLAVLGVRAAADRQAFDLQRLEGRYRDSAFAVTDRLPPAAVLITVWQSGSVRFHAGREAVLWDSMDPAWLDRAVSWLSSRGMQPYFLFERGEENDFRSRFRGHSELGALDWPPRFDINRQARVYDPADRARYQAGQAYPTEIIRPR